MFFHSQHWKFVDWEEKGSKYIEPKASLWKFPFKFLTSGFLLYLCKFIHAVKNVLDSLSNVYMWFFSDIISMDMCSTLLLEMEFIYILPD